MNFYKKSSGKNPEDFFSPYLTLADEATAYIDPENVNGRIRVPFYSLQVMP